MEVTENTVRSGRAEISKKAAKGMGKDAFYEAFKGKLSDPIDAVWSAVCGEQPKKEDAKTKDSKPGGKKPSHQEKLSDGLEKK